MKVLVYGSLKKGGWLHGHLSKPEVARLPDRIVRGWGMVDLGAFPAAYPSTMEDSILCEEYEITPEVLDRLDWAEGYPHFYNRVEVDGAWLYHHTPEAVQGRSTDTKNITRTSEGAQSWIV